MRPVFNFTRDRTMFQTFAAKRKGKKMMKYEMEKEPKLRAWMYLSWNEDR